MARVSIVIHFLTHSVNLSLTMGLLLLIAPMISLGWLFYANLGGHAYSLTGAKTLYAYKRGRLKKVELVCIRNPWGNEVEWKGPWSDHGESLWHFWNFIQISQFFKLLISRSYHSQLMIEKMVIWTIKFIIKNKLYLVLYVAFLSEHYGNIICKIIAAHEIKLRFLGLCEATLKNGSAKATVYNFRGAVWLPTGLITNRIDYQTEWMHTILCIL